MPNETDDLLPEYDFSKLVRAPRRVTPRRRYTDENSSILHYPVKYPYLRSMRIKKVAMAISCEIIEGRKADLIT